MKHDNWFNEEYMNQRRSEVIDVANKIIDGATGVIEGARELHVLQYEVSEDDFDSDFMVFNAINSETDHLPIGKVREQWSSSTLEMKDEEKTAAEKRFRKEAISACKKLIKRFEKNS
ncbi:MAG: DUF2489 domain-containing protein [Deltaproteobacteria bacterium]|nr:DUF2489 domain-containing protein [Deltaproteobacteria bacterium]